LRPFPYGLPPREASKLTSGESGLPLNHFRSGACPSYTFVKKKSLEETRLKAPAGVFTLEYRLASF
jgi:hypothetical protein